MWYAVLRHSCDDETSAYNPFHHTKPRQRRRGKRHQGQHLGHERCAVDDVSEVRGTCLFEMFWEASAPRHLYRHAHMHKERTIELDLGNRFGIRLAWV